MVLILGILAMDCTMILPCYTGIRMSSLAGQTASLIAINFINIWPVSIKTRAFLLLKFGVSRHRRRRRVGNEKKGGARYDQKAEVVLRGISDRAQGHTSCCPCRVLARHDNQIYMPPRSARGPRRFLCIPRTREKLTHITHSSALALPG